MESKWKNLFATYKRYVKNKNTTGESTKSFVYFDDMSLELADRPDIKPRYLKGTSLEEEEPQKENASSPVKEAATTPAKKRKMDKDEKLEKLIEATCELKPILVENQRIEQERNDMFKDFLSFLKNKK